MNYALAIALFFLNLILPSAWACPPDTYELSKVVANTNGNPPELILEGRVNGQEPFRLHLDDVEGATAFLTILLNPYYGITEHQIEGNPPELGYLEKKSRDLLAAIRMAEKANGGQRLPKSELTGEALNTELKSWAEKLSLYSTSTFESNGKIQSRMYKVSSSDGKSHIQLLSQGGADGQAFQVEGVGTVQRFDTHSYYAPKNIVEALYRTAALGSSGARGGTPVPPLNNPGHEKLLRASLTGRCLLWLKGVEATSAIEETLKFFNAQPVRITPASPERGTASVKKKKKTKARPAKRE